MSSFKEKIGTYLFWGILGVVLVLAMALMFSNALEGRDILDPQGFTSILFQAILVSIPLIAIVIWLHFKFKDDGFSVSSGSTKGQPKQFYSNRWMTRTEINKEYIFTTLGQIKNAQKTGTLARFEMTGRDIAINMVPKDYHTIVLGTTGSGKTQGYVLPYVYTLGHTAQKPNMVITDPKGEIYNFMAEELKQQGYEINVLNLSQPTKSSRWNPFEQAWDMFQRAHHIERELIKHTNKDPKAMGLKVITSDYPTSWYEFNKIAFPTLEMAANEIKTMKQQLLSDSEADIKNICSSICPIENEKDPSWEQGARDLINGTALAMLEDSLIPELGMTKQKFNFYNIYKMLTLRDPDPNASFASISAYFEGRGKFSPAVPLAMTVIANAENTKKNYFGIATGKLSMFADKGICYMTSGTELNFEQFIKKPTVLFLIIPDQKKERHPLAVLCVTQLYKNLVDLANGIGGKLPWPTYFVLDEFGNMPKFNNFATIITVSRSRNIFLTLVLQDYNQLKTTYGEEEAITVRNNCNIQIFIGVNDKDTREQFSNLLGEMTITKATTSQSRNTGKSAENDAMGGSKSKNFDEVSRPLLPPNELLDLVQGTIYVYCFGYHPLRSTVTLFYKCLQSGVIKLAKTPDVYVPAKFFDENAIFYDIRRRNQIVTKQQKAKDSFDW
ncbi:MAG: type IV secretory system conjugative DNA transfer family protein [Christensenellaceae bacterium]|jgi:type IV secretory pathway TraG/TraD family ATPase VirD4|nr:type IV secretory system conjugative DNA transfer family protein [Christensenellaceae bacterium]